MLLIRSFHTTSTRPEDRNGMAGTQRSWLTSELSAVSKSSFGRRLVRWNDVAGSSPKRSASNSCKQANRSHERGRLRVVLAAGTTAIGGHFTASGGLLEACWRLASALFPDKRHPFPRGVPIVGTHCREEGMKSRLDRDQGTFLHLARRPATLLGRRKGAQRVDATL